MTSVTGNRQSLYKRLQNEIATSEYIKTIYDVCKHSDDKGSIQKLVAQFSRNGN